MSSRRACRGDLSDARWALIEPSLTTWRAARRGPGTAARVHDLPKIVNAILYVCRTGIAWEYLPHNLPPCKTVHDYYAKREVNGTTKKPHDLPRQRVRTANGRVTTPTTTTIDSQSVKTTCNVDESSQGIDAGKKTKDRKRHIATDVLGLLLVVIVTAASAQDSATGQQAPERIAVEHPTVPMAWANGGHNNDVANHGARLEVQVQVQVQVVKHPTTKRLQVLPRRWLAKPTLG